MLMCLNIRKLFTEHLVLSSTDLSWQADMFEVLKQLYFISKWRLNKVEQLISSKNAIYIKFESFNNCFIVNWRKILLQIGEELLFSFNINSIVLLAVNSFFIVVFDRWSWADWILITVTLFISICQLNIALN